MQDMCVHISSDDEHLYLLYHGGSMRSLFQPLERLRVKRCSIDDVSKGDVVVFRQENRDMYIVHRVKEHRSGDLVTQGDDRVHPDKEVVTREQFVGLVDAVWRNGSWKRVAGGHLGRGRAKLWQSIRTSHQRLLSYPATVGGKKVNNSTLAQLPIYFFRLLIACQQGRSREEILSIPLHVWPGITAMATRHELTSYLYFSFEHQEALDLLPNEVITTLRDHYQKAWARQQRFIQAHLSIQFELAQKGVDCISLKGLWYAQELYPGPSARAMTDLDYLVRPEDMDKALAVFIELGYNRIQAEDSAASEKEIWLQHPVGGVKVDLHRDLVPYYSDLSWDTNEIWSRSGEVTLMGAPARVLGIEDQILHIIVHGSLEHMLQPLRVLFDARLAMEKWGTQVDWKVLRPQAEQMGVGAALDLMLEALRKVFVEQELNLPPQRRYPPEKCVHWLLQTAPILKHEALLQLFAARDYVFYLRSRMYGKSDKVQASVAPSESKRRKRKKKTRINPFYLVSRAIKFLMLSVGLLASSIRHPERKYITYFQLLMWMLRR
ncbi:MAG TPA: hypothetical protein ENH10_00315 [Bacteroidetes bacterium]|nr:hypothetical protein BMS3Bbin04_01032 [bacterium BMS3Bbin04]HDO64464.1 hypothetical protein [Bacteroidota bacterium]HEX03589.1 hypothetical protein [Bacteroidota bacterium]